MTMKEKIFQKKGGSLRNPQTCPVLGRLARRRLFDLLKDRLYRLQILKTDEGSYLFMDFHHILYDGASCVILMQDISTAYGGGRITPETYTGFEAALDEEKLRKTDRYESARAYFAKLLANAEPDMLPEGDVYGEEAGVGSFRIPSEISIEAVSEFCKKNDLGVNAFFNAAFAFLMGKYNLRDDVLYTTVNNGRRDPRLKRSVMMLVQTFPVFCHLDGEGRLLESLFVSFTSQR